MKMGKMHPERSKARKISGLESLIIKLYIIYIMRHNFWCGNCIVLLTTIPAESPSNFNNYLDNGIKIQFHHSQSNIFKP